MQYALKNYSLFWKVLLGAMLTGMLTWAALDYFQTRHLHNIFSVELASRLEEKAFHNRERFDQMIKTITQAARMVAGQSTVHSHVEMLYDSEGERHAGGDVPVPQRFDGLPKWANHLHRAVNAVLVLDRDQHPREIYNIHDIALPRRLFTATALILRLSNNQVYLMEEDKRLFLIISTPIVLPDGRRPATIMYVSEISATFMLMALGPSQYGEGITAFISGDPARVMVSGDPILIPPGTPVSALEQDYKIIGKTFLDYGMSELHAGFASFVPRETFSRLLEPLSSMGRQQRTLTAVIISFAFIIPMLFVLKNVRQLSNRVTSFMEQVFDSPPQGIHQGDELHTLNTEFSRLIGEVQLSRQALQKEAAGLRRESDEHRKTAAQLMVEKHKSEAANKELSRYSDRLEEQVSERTKRLAKALQQEKEYSALQRKFVSLVSHEFRTPLTIIDGAAQRLIRLKERLSADELEVRSKKIRNAVERMIKMIDSTLYAAQLDADKVEAQLEPCDISKLLRVVCDHQAEAIQAGSFKLDIDALPDKVMADCTLLNQVFTNLLANAVKYSRDNAQIEISGRAEEEWAVVSVTDHGIGIPAEDIPNMFKRYFRAHNSTGIQGTGIGLSISKEFVEMHGGTIAVVSTEGEGATFTVQLPIAGRR